MREVILTKDTLIPIGAVILVLSAAFSYGAMYAKVQGLSDQFIQNRTETRQEIAALREDIKELNSKIDEFLGRVATLSYER